MILQYYGMGISRDTLDQYLLKESTTHSLSTFPTDGALFARQQGLLVDIFAYNLCYTDPTHDSRLTPDALVAKLERQQRALQDAYFAPLIESTIRCLQAGCRYALEKPNIQRIQTYLTARIPLLVSLNAAALYEEPMEALFTAHAVVLTGLVDGRIYFLDPNDGVERSTSPDQLLFAMLQSKVIATSAYMLAIQPARLASR